MASAGLNEENVEKRLTSVTNTQDSIQSLSLWIIHHKTHHARIVELWYKIMKKSPKPSHRLTLFYLCNDVVQNCKRKKAVVFIDTFKPLLKQATSLARDASIRGKVERIFNIWEERHVYDKDFVTQLKAVLDGKRGEERERKRELGMFKKPFSPKDRLKEKAKQRVREKVKEKSMSPVNDDLEDIQPADANLDAEKEEEKAKDVDAPNEETLAAFKPSELIDKMKVFKRQEAEMEIKVRQLSLLKLDASSIEAIKQLKDRAHGNEFSTQFEESCLRLEEAMKCLEKKKGEQRDLLAQLHISEYFYDQQFSEAKIVANAYKNYGSRINTMKRRLDELMRTLPSPSPSPTVDAPSPGNTPPQDDIDTSVGMDIDQDQSALNTESSSGSVALTTTTTSSILNPIPSIRKLIFGDEAIPSPPDEAPSPVGSSPGDTAPQDTGSIRLENRLASFLPTLQTVGSSVPLMTDEERPIPVYVPQPLNSSASSAAHRPSANKTLTEPDIPFQEDEEGNGGSTPLTDEQPSTPVLDEEEPASDVPSPPPPPPPVEKKENPIDFLSRLISQTQKNKVEGGLSSSSSFLESFTCLTSKVKEHMDLKKGGGGAEEDSSHSEEGSPGPKSWAAWKAEKSMGDGELPGLDIPPPPVPNFNLPPLPSSSSVPLPVPPPPDMPLPVPPPSQTSPRGLFFQHTSPGQKENWPQMGVEGAEEERQNIPSPNIVYPPVQDEVSPSPFPSLNTKAVQPVKGILRKNSNTVLRELTPSSEDPSSPDFLPPPPPPPPPPVSDVRPSMHSPAHREGPCVSALGPASSSEGEAQEFMEKLKRKTSGGSTPPAYTPNPIFPNLMTLTPGGEMDMDLDDEEEEEEEEEEENEMTRIPVLSSVVRRVGPEEQKQVREKEMQQLKDRDMDRLKNQQDTHDSPSSSSSSSSHRFETFHKERQFSRDGDQDTYFEATPSPSECKHRDGQPFNFERHQQQQQPINFERHQQQQQQQPINFERQQQQQPINFERQQQQQQPMQSPPIRPQLRPQMRPPIFPNFSPNNLRNMSPNVNMFQQRGFGPRPFLRPQPNRPFHLQGLLRGLNQRGFQF
ncbi:uncharacterized protein LOC143296935 isoform X2 [Babylonia areolata]|uniref:uncharacterized protein LOC143296935 isoform X2 n=1 Tax=Babylonia areolata TaxID=304850 RepID=UPI003FD24C61